MQSSPKRVRPAAVAGLFYDADPSRLAAHIDSLLAHSPEPGGPTPRALIVPHAGYVYSGATAALAFRHWQLLHGKVRRVALFGPAHRVYLQGMAIPETEAFATPLGEVPLDGQGLHEIAAMPGVSRSDEAHLGEHSLEVQLPFLQTVLGEFSLVPVVVGDCEPGAVACVMDHLAQDEDTLLVISTDLSHFHSYAEAEHLDAKTCERILARDDTLRGENACGARVLNGLMRTDFSRSLQLELLHRCNSGDSAGDRQRVVGYGAFSLH